MTSPMIIAMVVVLPAPLPPSKPGDRAGRERKRNAVDGRHLLVDFDQPLDGYGGRGGHEPQMWRVRPMEARAERMAIRLARGWMSAAKNGKRLAGWRRAAIAPRMRGEQGRHAMKIGLFDHVEDGERPVCDSVRRAACNLPPPPTKAGFYCLHVAEHHATPLNMVPVPGVYLGAVARATKRIRLGPLVYLLPLYSPLRLIEEICMLDHFCHGRLEVGVGRGVSPFELKFHKVEPRSRAKCSSMRSNASSPA